MKAKVIGIVFVCILLAIAAAVLGGGWYYFLGSKPKIVLSIPVSGKGLGVQDAKLIGPRDLVVVVDGEIRRYVGLKEKWAKKLKEEKTPEQYKAELTRVNEQFVKLRQWSDSLNQRRNSLKSSQEIRAFNEEAAKYHAELRAAQTEDARVRAALSGKHPAGDAQQDREESAWRARDLEQTVFGAENSVWIIALGKAIQVNRQTGDRMKEVVLPGEPELAEQSGDDLFMVAQAPDRTKRLLRIGMKEGKCDQLMVAPDSEGTAAPANSRSNTPEILNHCTDFVVSGSVLVQLDTDLVEKKITERKAMKPISAQQQSTSKTGWGDGATEVVKMMEDDAQREATGGVDRIDQSRYKLTLRRDFANPAIPDWKGEVEGRPMLFHAKTVDILVADRRLFVFDNANHQKWAAQLTYPVRLPMDRLMLDKDEKPCCLEAGSVLYVWDAGFLTAFQLADGQVRWRIPSVGIQDVKLGGDGMLYVHTLNRSAETLTYTQESTIGDTAKPLIMKVDPSKGDVLWRAEGFEKMYVSGRYVYATRSPVNPMETVNSVFDRKAPKQRFLLYKLRRDRGVNDWDFFEPRIPGKIEPDGRDLVLVFQSGVDVVSSWAF